jgi:threonine dehydrogenase-like Zn-dependent dehydrogenase
MKALYFDGAGGLEWHDDPTPVIEAPSDAIVRPLAVSTCDLDQVIIHGKRPVPGSEQPYPIGHEGVGEVVAIGDSVTTVRPGDKVAIAYHLSCGRCDRCHRGLPLFCRTIPVGELAIYGTPVGRDYGGLFSELVRVPFADYSLLALPPGIEPLEAFAVGDNLADAWRVVAPHLVRQPGADVLVISEGSIGLFAADIARALGAGRVRYVDPDSARLEIAASLGVETTALRDFSEHEHEYEISVITHANVEAMRKAILSTAPGGYHESCAFHFKDPEVPLLAMHMKCLHFRTALSNARVYMPDVLDLISSGRIRPRDITTAVVPFEDAAEAMHESGFKPVFVREPTAA